MVGGSITVVGGTIIVVGGFVTVVGGTIIVVGGFITGGSIIVVWAF